MIRTLRTLIILAGACLPSFSIASDVIPRSTEELTRIESAISEKNDFSKAESFEAMSGGATTNTNIFTRDVFSQPSSNMSFEDELTFKVGNGFFRKLWVSSPSSTKTSDGLGPIFNARACQSCHFKDGRGRPSSSDDRDSSLFLRLAIPGKSDMHAANIPDPVYGSQLQDKSNIGIPAEGRMVLSYEIKTIELADGERVELRKPNYQIDQAAYGALDDNIQLSPRIAQQMIGLGLIEAIDPADILANEDIDDENGDGISGRANLVWSRDNESFMLGRFGHKAGNATIRDQAAAAFSGDMGLSTSLFPDSYGECTQAQEKCQSAPDGADESGVEVSDDVLALVEFYSANLAVPMRKEVDDPQVLKGKEIFYDIGCTSCHRPKYVTQRFSDNRPQSFQLIWPYSDFLLHDMGEGLADEVSEFEAKAGEWRTPPLWGIGQTKLVTGEANFLHDGRARNVLEAILWHGGEAEQAQKSVVALIKEDRDALIKFLESQ